MNKLAFFLLLTLFNMPVHAIGWSVVVEGIKKVFYEKINCVLIVHISQFSYASSKK